MTTDFHKRVLDAAHRALEIEHARTEAPNIAKSSLYVVWFSKVLQNHKALISTDVVEGLYVEVTFNGIKNEYYVDIYTKRTNRVITGTDI